MAATLRVRTVSEFGNLPSSQKGGVIQSGNYFLTQDGTGTPQTSPLSYTAAVSTIVVPQGSVQVSLLPTTDLLISELVAMGQTDLIKANTKEIISVSQLAKFYIKESSVDGVLYFKFIFV